MSEVILIVGSPASGKSTVSEKYISDGYIHLNRDKVGGHLKNLIPMMEKAIDEGKNIILDNCFASIESRAGFLEAAKRKNVPIKCLRMGTSIEEAQYNASLRMIQRRGKILGPEELKKEKDPNLFPATVLFKFKNEYQEPSIAEGFSSVETVPFVRRVDPSYTNKALILDYDDTLRKTKSGSPYPTNPDDIEILPGRTKRLQEYKDKGYLLLGVSNQSGVAKGVLTYQQAVDCFERTNQLLGHSIDYVFCPHTVPPIVCFCRKPMPAHGVAFIEKYKLDRKLSIFVGDQTSDKTFANRSGFQYIDQEKFFQ